MKRVTLPIISVVLFIGLTAAGCSQVQKKAGLLTETTVTNVSPTTGTTSPIPSALAAPTGTASSPQATMHADKGTLTLSNDNKPDNTLTAGKPPENGYTSLLGLTLASIKSEVETRFGKPAETYVMESDTDPVFVSDYGTFSIGFRADGTLVFIDIGSNEIDPELGGVKIGHKAEDVEKTLGKPDLKSNYSMAYESKTTVLKIDLDPKTKAILSIKLFGRYE